MLFVFCIWLAVAWTMAEPVMSQVQTETVLTRVRAELKRRKRAPLHETRREQERQWLAIMQPWRKSGRERRTRAAAARASQCNAAVRRRNYAVIFARDPPQAAAASCIRLWGGAPKAIASSSIREPTMPDVVLS